MVTDTHVHLRITQSDWCTSRPLREMEKPAWRKYLRFLMVNEGFDMTRPVVRSGGVPGFDVVLSQERSLA